MPLPLVPIGVYVAAGVITVVSKAVKEAKEAKEAKKAREAIYNNSNKDKK